MSNITMNPITFDMDSFNYQETLNRYLGVRAPKTVTALGNLGILQNKSLAVISSNKCPGRIIIKTYDFMRQIRETGITVISGFHSAIERECLNILLKGKQPVIICPARSIEGMKIKPEFKKPLADGRLLILSPFGAKEKRIAAGLAEARNHFVAALAETVFIPYAAPGSKSEKFCGELFRWGKRIYTLPDESNNELISSGAESTTTALGGGS